MINLPWGWDTRPWYRRGERFDTLPHVEQERIELTLLKPALACISAAVGVICERMPDG